MILVNWNYEHASLKYKYNLQILFPLDIFVYVDTLVVYIERYLIIILLHFIASVYLLRLRQIITEFLEGKIN